MNVLHLLGTPFLTKLLECLVSREGLKVSAEVLDLDAYIIM